MPCKLGEFFTKKVAIYSIVYYFKLLNPIIRNFPKNHKIHSVFNTKTWNEMTSATIICFIYDDVSNYWGWLSRFLKIANKIENAEKL